MRKIMWAVDPYQDQAQRLAHDAKLLSTWFGKGVSLRIVPVFVLTSRVRLMPFGTFRELLPELTEEARERIDHLQRQLRHLPMAEAKILVHPSDHVESVAESLLAYADAKNADLIALRTQGKRGLARFFLGSLAETLLKKAKLPVLVLEPHRRSRQSRTYAEPLRRQDRARLRKLSRVA